MIQKADDSNLEHFLSNNEKVVVKFHADWCGVCKAFAPQFAKIAREESGDILFLEVNAPDNPKARLLAGVYSLPFFATFEKGELTNKVSSSDRSKVMELINKIKKSRSAVA